MHLIDTHCHIDFAAFDADRKSVLDRAQQQGIQSVIVPATHYATWEKLAQTCAEHEACYPAYGLHPMFLVHHEPEHLQHLRTILEQQDVLAVGECGLDFFIKDLDQQRQIYFFQEQLKLAAEFDKPVIIHARKSLDIVLKHLRQFDGLRGIVHSFSGSLQQAEQLIQQDFYLGVGGTVTYERAKRLQRVLFELPLEAMVLETDAPDQPDAQWRGKRNEPCRLPIIAQVLAELKGVAVEEVAQVTSDNAKRLFNLD